MAFLAGCALALTWKSNPETQKITNDSYEVLLSPTRVWTEWNCYDSFALGISNKTDKNIEVVWDKTLFICNGTTLGGFMFEGVVYKDRNNPKPNDIVFPKQKFIKTIFPNTFVGLGQYGWTHKCFPAGEVGAYVVMKANGQEVSEKVTVVIQKPQ
jgi:hypothetical protein